MATRLIAFQFYGCAADGTCGGRAILRIHIAPDAAPWLPHPGLLEINCQVGNPPAGTSEGVKLNIPGIIHFNRHVHEGGVTLFLPG